MLTIRTCKAQPYMDRSLRGDYSVDPVYAISPIRDQQVVCDDRKSVGAFGVSQQIAQLAPIISFESHVLDRDFYCPKRTATLAGSDMNMIPKSL